MIDTALPNQTAAAEPPPDRRQESFLAQAGNPYCFRVGKTPVRISFAAGGKPLEEELRSYFMDLKARSSSPDAR